MAAVALMLVLMATVLTDATPITTQIEVLQSQVLTLNGVLDHVIKEFGNLRQRHEDLETKFNGLSVELSSLRTYRRPWPSRTYRRRWSNWTKKRNTGSRGLAGHIDRKGDSCPQGWRGSKGQRSASGSKRELGENSVQQKIAFHAQLGNDFSPLTDNEIIIMRSGLVQLGTGYDENTGIFTCPVAGLYVFSVTIVIERHGNVEVELLRNGHGILYIYAGDEEKHGSGTNMALIELQVNDKVWVQVHDHYYVQGEGLLNHFTTFSGFLLYP